MMDLALRLRFPVLLIASSAFAFVLPVHSVSFSKIVIDASAEFECSGIGDIDGDGKNEIVSGSYWYDYPSLERHFICEIPESHGYRDDFSNFPIDVDGDGDLDIVSVTWFSKKAAWRENPGNGIGTWKEHAFDSPGNMETAFLADLSGDGVPDLVTDVAQGVMWYERLDPNDGPPYWNRRSPGKEGVEHGLGSGDLNGDGRLDIITPLGWYEAPENRDEDEWIWHPEFNLGRPGVPIQGHDVNGDGLTDIVWGLGHDYGVFWLEQKPGSGDNKIEWVRHTIDDSWSQAHVLFIVDLDGNGPGVLTGKRYYAHNGNDPGGNDPVGVYYYRYDRDNGEWNKMVLDYGNRVGLGLMPAVDDLDGDGDIDIICSGKSGLYLLLNESK